MDQRNCIGSILCVIVAGGCDRTKEKPEEPATPFTARGTIAIDGETDSVASCDLRGYGANETATIGLASGAIFTMPLQDTRATLQRNADAQSEEVRCNDLYSSIELGMSSMKAKLEGSCPGENTEITMNLELECGPPAPS
jgi:hypothetical protein